MKHECDKRQECNICHGTFKMERGCLLEKRCPACRILERGGTKATIKKYSPIGMELYWAYYSDRTKNSRMDALDCDVDRFCSFDYDIEDRVIDDSFEERCAEETRNIIMNVLLMLNVREQEIVCLKMGLFTGDNLTNAEVGRALGLTRIRIQQIESSAMKKLKHPKIGRKLLCVMPIEGVCDGRR